jgi:HAE1 family hydrophobic/amphiphilic exporter-1
VSVLVIPSFAAQVVKGGQGGSGALVQRFAAWVGRVAAWCSASLPRALGVSGSVIAATVLLTAVLTPPMEDLPTGNRNLLFGIMVPPPGTSVEEIVRSGTRFQGDISRHVEADLDGVPSIERTFFVARPSIAFMGASATDPDRIGDLVNVYRGKQKQVPGMFGVASQASLFGRGIGSSRAIDVELSGRSLEELVAVGGRMMGVLKQTLPDAQVRPIPSLDLGAPELQVRPRRVDGARVGLSGQALGESVDALVDGWIIGELGRDGQPNLRVVLTADEGGVLSPDALGATLVATPSGDVVPLSAIADVVETKGPATIQRIERRRSITLQVSPPDDLALETAMNTIRNEVVPASDVPSTVRVTLAGTADDLSVAKGKFLQVLLLAVVISFLLMAALFEDFLAPLVILVTVPMSAAGGVLALRAVDLLLRPQPFDMMTAVGFVLLIGVVVNNAILVVDGALARLRAGDPLAEAVEGAVVRRVRPILMSTLTSLAGLLPLVLMPGSGSELYRGVGAVVLGGLALATVLTMFVVPAVFTLTWRLAGRA